MKKVPIMLLSKFLTRSEFSSYEDFKRNYELHVPENFNFGYDVVDAWAAHDPHKRALVWCNDHGGERSFTFAEISALSNQAANFFTNLGIRKGDRVIFFLSQRWQYWPCAVALHKIGAILIPAAIQLTAKDVAYRCGAAGIKAIVAVSDPYVNAQIDQALPDCPTVEHKIRIQGAGGREQGNDG